MSRLASTGRHALVALALATVLASCSVFGASEGEVTGRAEPPVLILKNETGRTAHFFAAEETTLARIELMLGDYRDWPSIGPGETKEVPFEDISFYEDGDTSIWVRWETGRRGGAFTVTIQ